MPTSSFPTTGFAVNSDKASYPNIRRFINGLTQVPINAVRIDEMVNYFSLHNTHPNDSATFNISSQFTQCPWNKDNLLMFLNVTARKLDLSQIPPSNLVFLIDNSGSMEMQNRMELLKSSFKSLIKNLRTEDKITIITYGGGIDVLTNGLSGGQKDSLNKLINEMEAGGETPGEKAILTAYEKAKQHFINKGNNRIIIATDGDFNVGIADEQELERLILKQSEVGIYLTCVGIGVGNYKDSKLEIIAKKGKGNFAYLDSEQEAEQVFVKELTQTLYSVANDVFMNMSFNNEYIASYRLIGYDNKVTALQDSSSKLEGGQVGSGYSSIIIFELSPTAALKMEEVEQYLEKTFGSIAVQFTDPFTKELITKTDSCKFNFKPLLSLPNQYGFASAVAMYGSYLKNSRHNKEQPIYHVISLANKVVDKNDPLQTEFLKIIDKTEDIYEPNAKRKRKKQNHKQLPLQKEVTNLNN